MTDEEKKKPVFKVKYGSIDAAVWEQEGKNGTFLTTSLHRNYKDNDGNWKQTNTLRISDIADVRAALQDCFVFARTRKSEKKEGKDGEDAE